MKRIAVGEFKEKCLSILDRLTGDGLVITKRGQPIARLLPMRGPSVALFDSLKGKLKITGDILSTGVEWDAQSRHTHSPVRGRRRPSPRRT